MDYDESIFTMSGDFDKYDTDMDDDFAWAICTIELVMNERNYETVGDIFGQIYDITNGVKLFNEEGAFQVSVFEIYDEIELPYPEYEESWDDETDEAMVEEWFTVDESIADNAFM